MCPAKLNPTGERGFIIPIGGGEDRVKDMHIHRLFVELSGGAAANIVVIPTASQMETTGADYNRMFRDLGAARVEIPVPRPRIRLADDGPRLCHGRLLSRFRCQSSLGCGAWGAPALGAPTRPLGIPMGYCGILPVMPSTR